jgi:hypothetical protein
LVSLTIQPQNFIFLIADAGQTEQLTALATYIHPPATKDVTSQATWSVDDGVVAIGAGLVKTIGNGACGGADISATMPEGTGGDSNIVTAPTATITVDDPTNPICPGGGKLATLAVGVIGQGSVTSTPTAISCPSTCVATYDVGASVLLTASSINVVWGNCPGSSSNTCVVAIPTGGTAVSATFN